MHREDNSVFLLYLEPKAVDRATVPINDEIVEVVTLALKRAKKGVGSYTSFGEPVFREGNAYKGWHTTDCGTQSDNVDYLLENGMITNSLAPYYLQYYRHVIPAMEMFKVNLLVKYFYEKGLQALG